MTTHGYGGGYGGGGVKSIITRDMFEEMLKHRNDKVVAIRGFYTYDAFIEATRAFPDFGTTGNIATRRRELAAFFAQTSHETTGGWDGAPDGRYAWGYCFNREQNPISSYCDFNNQEYPCAPRQHYFGRGPKQLSWNYNYGQCGRDLGVDLLNNPDLLITDPVLSFKSAIWFWMTPQPPKPSCHDVMVGNWHPSRSDKQAGRVPGYGVLTNIINGGVESGHGRDERVESRIGFFKRYCSLLGVDYGNEDTLDCYHQRPFG